MRDIISLIPDPLHPAVVHLPIALTLLVPLFAVGALWAIRRGARVTRAWGLTTALLALLAGSAWVAVETGEQQEEKVEPVVGERALDVHEEAAELFLALSGGVLVVAALGFVRGTVGKVARVVGTAGTAVLLVSAWNVGHTGGELVYRHDAGRAFGGTVADNPAARGELEGLTPTDSAVRRHDEQ